MLNASVVDQNIDAAKFLLGKLHHGFNFCGLAHVGAVIGHFGAQCCNFSFGSGMVTKAIQNNVGALLGQGFGNAQANAAGRAGDECSFAFQHGGSPNELRCGKSELWRVKATEN